MWIELYFECAWKKLIQYVSKTKTPFTEKLLRLNSKVCWDYFEIESQLNCKQTLKTSKKNVWKYSLQIFSFLTSCKLDTDYFKLRIELSYERHLDGSKNSNIFVTEETGKLQPSKIVGKFYLKVVNFTQTLALNWNLDCGQLYMSPVFFSRKIQKPLHVLVTRETSRNPSNWDEIAHQVNTYYISDLKFQLCQTDR